MSDDVRHTWNNERWVIDRLVDAVEAGDTDAKAKLGQRLLDGIAEDNWTAWAFIDAGPFLPLTCLAPANIEDDDRDWFCGDETIPDARLDEVLNGRMNGRELARWRERVVDRAFLPDEGDRDMRWFIIEVRRAGGRVAYVASFGHPTNWADWYDLLNTSFVAAFDTYTETLNALKSVGFTSPTDYLARSTAMLAGS